MGSGDCGAAQAARIATAADNAHLCSVE